jgi:hypothetical protein
MFIILTDGVPLIYCAFRGGVYNPKYFEERIASLRDPECAEIKELFPSELLDGFRPILLALL